MNALTGEQSGADRLKLDEVCRSVRRHSLHAYETRYGLIHILMRVIQKFFTPHCKITDYYDYGQKKKKKTHKTKPWQTLWLGVVLL